jgi:hypothetical protein
VPDRALISGRRRAGSWPIPWEGRNSQIGVFLGYACAAGRAQLNVRLYLPRSWGACEYFVLTAASAPTFGTRLLTDLRALFGDRDQMPTTAILARWSNWTTHRGPTSAASRSTPGSCRQSCRATASDQHRSATPTANRPRVTPRIRRPRTLGSPTRGAATLVTTTGNAWLTEQAAALAAAIRGGQGKDLLAPARRADRRARRRVGARSRRLLGLRAAAPPVAPGRHHLRPVPPPRPPATPRRGRARPGHPRLRLCRSCATAVGLHPATTTAGETSTRPA